jgi:hypothetical protein
MRRHARSCLDRQYDSECRFAGLTAHRQIAAMGLQNPMGDAQTETRTRYLVLYGWASIKAFEDPGLLLTRYAFAVIRDSNRHCAVVAG